VKLPVTLLLAQVLLIACGSSTPRYCSNAVTIGTALQTKFGTCDAGGVPLPGMNCSNTSGCTTAFNLCAAADQSALVAQQNCLLDAPACQPGGEFAWALSIAQCQSDAGTLSTACGGYFEAAASDAGCS
jgi:hypothetical protein